MRNRRLTIFWLGALFLAVVIGGAGGARPAQAQPARAMGAAAVITVTTPLDEYDSTYNGYCSLREAIAQREGCSGGDTIVLPGGVYTLTLAGTGNLGDLDISRNLTITTDGGQATILAGAGLNNRVIKVAPEVTAIISNTIIRGGNISGDGGGIFNYGNLTLVNGVVMQNKALSSLGGGGIFNGGILVLRDSAVISNTAGYGGGIYNGNFTTLKNITLSGNTAATDGGGIYNGGASITLLNVTIASNTAARGSGLWLDSSASAANSIIAGNSGGDCNGTINSQGYNLIGSTSGCTINGLLTGVISNTAPLLGPLTDNGGGTLTHALLTGSPALNSGDNATCEATDQRGVPRPQGQRCDLGAFELERTRQVDLAVHVAAAPDPVISDDTLTYTVTISNAGALTATSVVLTDTLPSAAMFVTATAGICSGSGPVRCDWSTLPGGGSQTVWIAVRAPGSAGTLTNTVTISSPEPDLNFDNNSTAIATTVRQRVIYHYLYLPLVLR